MFPFTPVTLPIGFYVTACTIIGVIGNIAIVLVTYASIHLRSSCAVIIAFNCFFDSLHLLGHVTYIEYLFTQELIPQSICFFYHIHSQIGLLSSAPFLLILALDRLIAIAIPIKYQLLQKYVIYYVTALMLIPITYTTTLFYLSFRNRVNDLIICDVPTSAAGVLTLNSEINMVLYPIIGIMYLAVLLILRKKGANSQFKLVFKSVTISVFFMLVTWIISFIAVVYAEGHSLNSETKNQITFISGLGINTAIASHFFVYYYFSTLYSREIRRILFRKQLGSVRITSSIGA